MESCHLVCFKGNLNVHYWKNDKIIVIQGFEPEIKDRIKKSKKKKVKVRKLRWKDVTKAWKMVVELKVTIKDFERKLDREFVIYESFTFDETDPIISQCVDELVKEFKGDPEDIIVKAMMVYR